MTSIRNSRWLPAQLCIDGGWRLLGFEERGQRVVVLFSLAEAAATAFAADAVELHDRASDSRIPLRWMHSGGSGADHLRVLVFEGRHGDRLRLLIGRDAVVDADLGTGHVSLT